MTIRNSFSAWTARPNGGKKERAPAPRSVTTKTDKTVKKTNEGGRDRKKNFGREINRSM